MLHFVESQAICSLKDQSERVGEEAKLKLATFPMYIGYTFFPKGASPSPPLPVNLSQRREWRGAVAVIHGSRWRRQVLLFSCAKSERDWWATVANQGSAHCSVLIWWLWGIWRCLTLWLRHAGKPTWAWGFREAPGTLDCSVVYIICIQSAILKRSGGEAGCRDPPLRDHLYTVFTSAMLVRRREQPERTVKYNLCCVSSYHKHLTK